MINSLLLSTGGIVAIVLGVVLGLLLIAAICVVAWWIKTRNAFVKLKNMIEEAWSNIDIFLKKRFDLIPNLVETVKGFAKHESETLERVIAARNLGVNATTPEEKMAASKAMSGSLKMLFNVVSENYPQLQANTNFLDLQNQLKRLEEELESARRYYNGVVKKFNTKLELFPDTIIGKRMGEGYEKKSYFELDGEEERKNVKVQF